MTSSDIDKSQIMYARLIWLASFASNRIRWRGMEFTVRQGRLIPVPPRRGRR